MRKRSQLTSDRLQAQSLSAEVEGPITFTLGKQHFAPIQFFNFEVGPFECTLQPKAVDITTTHRETYAEMLVRATNLLEDMFDAEFERQLNKFLDRVERMGEVVRDRKRK